MEDIKVHVVKYKTRPNLVMRYVDPLTGRQVARSAKTARRKDAEKFAAKWEAELREGRYQRQSRMTWAEFRDRYEREKIDSMSLKYSQSWQAAANQMERTVAPKLLASIDAAVISQFQAKLKAEGMKPATLASHLRTLRAAFGWAERQNLIAKVPRFEMPKLVKGARTMRGRPITTEEYERIIDKVATVKPVKTAQWKRLITGLWLSGLRLGEALQLSWDPDAAITVYLDGRYPMLRIYGEAQKSKRDGLLPIAPEFAEFLLATPESERRGFVFALEGPEQARPTTTVYAGRTIARIGEAAMVVVDANVLRLRVDKETGATKSVPKCATAHDLRRAFGTRWSKRVMPALLQKLMRHATIETSMKFYVEHNADDISADLWNWKGSVTPTAAYPPGETQLASARKSLPCNAS